MDVSKCWCNPFLGHIFGEKFRRHFFKIVFNFVCFYVNICNEFNFYIAFKNIFFAELGQLIARLEERQARRTASGGAVRFMLNTNCYDADRSDNAATTAAMDYEDVMTGNVTREITPSVAQILQILNEAN